MYFVWISEQTVPFALYTINRLVFVTEVESVYCTVQAESLVQTESLCNTDTFCPYSSETKVCVWCTTCYKTVSPMGDNRGQINFSNFPNWVAEKVSWFCLV